MQFEAILRGVGFRPIEAKEVVRKFQQHDDMGIGVQLTLVREPDNQFDSNAIQVVDPETEIHIGYVAKEVAAELAPYMDEGRQFTCIISGWMRDLMPMIEINEVETALKDAYDIDAEYGNQNGDK